jgi:hypothetical protein
MASSSPFFYRERKHQFITHLPFGRALVVIILTVPIRILGMTLLDRGDVLATFLAEGATQDGNGDDGFSVASS